MAGSPSGTERLGICAIRNDGLRLSGCMESTGVVLETLPHHPTRTTRKATSTPCSGSPAWVARRTCRSHRKGFDLAFPGKRSPARTQPPVEELDLEAMEELLIELRRLYPRASIYGHRDFSKKACPCFDARKCYANI